MRTVTCEADIEAIRATLRATSNKAHEALREVTRQENPLRDLKFFKLGCDPLDSKDPQNLAEQIDQQATHEVALHALSILFRRFPGKHWSFAPGARGAGHDVASLDSEVAAEVFAAVDPRNNRKLKKDIAKVGAFTGPYRFVFYRSPGHPPSTRIEGGVEIVSIGGV